MKEKIMIKIFVATFLILSTNALAGLEGDKFTRLDALENEITSLIARNEILERRVEALERKFIVDKDCEKVKMVSVDQNLEEGQGAKQYEQALQTLKSAGSVKEEMKKKYISKASREFSDFITNFPNSKLISSAYFWYGETYFRKNEFSNAAIEYLKSYKSSKDKDQKNPKGAFALMQLSLCLGELKKFKDACGILSKLDREFPQRPKELIKRQQDARMKFQCKY